MGWGYKASDDSDDSGERPHFADFATKKQHLTSRGIQEAPIIFK